MATKRNACSTPSGVFRIGLRTSAMACTGPACVWNATSTKSPCPSEWDKRSRPRVTEMLWSFALVRRPSSNRIAARTESPSWIRAARREGCGWGKWVISQLNYRTMPDGVTDYGSTCPDSALEAGFGALQVVPYKGHSTGLPLRHCPVVHRDG